MRANILLLDFFFLVLCNLSIRLIRTITPTLHPYQYQRDLFRSGGWLPENGKRARKFSDEHKEVFDQLPIDMDYEIRIVAAKRPDQYMSVTMSKLIGNFNQSRPNITICDVEPVDWREIVSVPSPIRVIAINRDIQEELEPLQKEASDYWKCLSLPTRSRYLLLLEDDALIIPKFPMLMKSLISQLDKKEEVDYVKLYHPTNLRKIPSLIQAISCSCLLLFGYYILMQKCHRRSWWIYVIIGFVLFVSIRRYSSKLFSDIRYAITGEVYLSVSESCCTPAVLFRKTSIKRMIQSLKNERAEPGHAKDHILDASNFTGRMTDANFVVHIGKMSLVRNKAIQLINE